MRTTLSDPFETIAGSWIPKTVLASFALGLLITAAIAIAQNVYVWTANVPPQGLATIDAGRLGMVVGTSGIATAFLTAFLVTRFGAERNYRRGREPIPHLTLTLTVTRTPASRSHDAVILTLHAKNTGTALCKIRAIRWSASALSPYDDQSVESMTQQFEQRHEHLERIEFPWQLAFQDTIIYDKAIEPGQTDQSTYLYLVDSQIDAIMASAFVYNNSAAFTTPGWYVRTPHLKPE